MEIEIKKKIKEFKLPNFVIVENTEKEESISIVNIKRCDLEKLCNNFKKAMLKKWDEGHTLTR